MSPADHQIDSDPGNAANYMLTCRECGWRPPAAMTMGEIQEKHFVRNHDTLEVTMNLTWCGIGLPPLAVPEWVREAFEGPSR